MSLKGKQVVAIDDTASIRTFLRVSFEDEGAIFHEAATAEEGINLCETLQPDIVVLDLGLPDMDGLDVLPRIKHDLQLKVPPSVIVLTVRKGRSVRDAASERGADAYLSKPFMVEDLLELIEEKIV